MRSGTGYSGGGAEMSRREREVGGGGGEGVVYRQISGDICGCTSLNPRG